jgi:predicted DsbA family dithiol-disulfide isomerase
MTAAVTIYSDLHCPWATIAISRLRAARERHGVDVVFDVRAWPLEWVNERGTPRGIVEAETALLAHVEPELFGRYRSPSWPSTFLPAFELVAAARRVGGLRAAEDVDVAIRRRFLREGADLSQRHELRCAVGDTDLDPDAVMKIWEREPVRGDVVDDYERSKGLPIQGSPQIFWPDGTTDHNPGMGLEMVRGLPHLKRNDPDEVARLLLTHVG